MKQAYSTYRRNFMLLVANYVFFGLALACFGSNTVMPVFLRRLTDSTPLIGLITAIFPVGWILPQLIAARWISNKPRRKPYLIYPSIIPPIAFGVLAAVLFTARPAEHGFLLPLFVICLTVTALSDGLVGVPWLDFIARAIPTRVRGRMMGLQELLFAGSSVGVGLLIAYLLGAAGPAFPQNFAWLAAGSAAAFLLGLLTLLPLREPAPERLPVNRPAWSEYLPLLGRIVRHDRPFLTLVGTRFLAGFSSLALPFYVLYATRELGLPASVAGLFLIAQVLGSASGSMLLGYLYERSGSRLVIRIVIAAVLAMPLMALLAAPLGRLGAPVEVFFMIIFFVAGMNASAMFLGYTNFVIDYAPPADRPVYLGLSNTLVGAVYLAPVLGGWILEIFNYHVLFIVTAGFLALAQVLAVRLPEPRHAVRAAPSDDSPAG